MRIHRLLPVLVVLLAIVAAPASGDVASRKQAIDARLQAVQAKIARADQRERALAADIASVNGQIRDLASQVGVVSVRLAPLERDLALHKEKLDRLSELYRVQTERFEFYRHEYDALIERLGNRLIDLYEGGEAGSLEVLLSARSFSDLISQADYIQAVGVQDKNISGQVGTAKQRVHQQRERTKRFRALAAAETRTIAVRANQVRALRDELLVSKNKLAAARSAKRDSLSEVKKSKQDYLDEAAGLAQASATLAGQLRSAQSSSSSSYSPSDGTPSSAGFIWPVNGPVVSPFGMRWGRLHAGIDIAAGTGTPIHAAASGRVVYSGWMDGYGYLVAIDHGRGISTAYAHQSSIAVSNGQIVSQGQVIGYVGCTGHCFGPHLHFEVRINGSPVDPLGYL